MLDNVATKSIKEINVFISTKKARREKDIVVPANPNILSIKNPNKRANAI